MTITAQQPVRAKLKFLADRSSPPVYVPSKGGGDQTRHLGNFRTWEVDIHDARVELPSSGLDREGFRLLSHHSAVQDFYDDQALRAIYHDELSAFLKEITGAHRIEVFDDTRRSSSLVLQRERGIREPANIVHNDYTARSGPRRLADFFAASPDEAHQLQKRRFAIINVWRSFGAPVVDQPLALCDATTVRDRDLVSVERRGADRIGELQAALQHAGQRWYYYPLMGRGEVLVFKTFDSALDGRTRFTLHSAFKNPRAPEGATARESLESRCLVFF